MRNVKRSGNCRHGLSLDVYSKDCCLVCISPSDFITIPLHGKLQDNIMASPIIKYFEYSNLSNRQQEISAAISCVAKDLDNVIPDCAEKSAGLRKLLEAKDCFVRAMIDE